MGKREGKKTVDIELGVVKIEARVAISRSEASGP